MNPADMHFPAILQHMTIARAARVRDLWHFGYRLRDVAEIVHAEWAADAEADGDAEFSLWSPPGDELAGMDLCRAAGIADP